MEIKKLNPIGYTTKTPEGNEYKKSNIGKSSLLATSVALDSFICFSKHPIAKSLSFEKLFVNDLKMNVSKKTKIAIRIAQYALDASFGYYIGSLIDKAVNGSRIQKITQAQSKENLQ